MLRENLASSLVFDWKQNWFLSRKLFLCEESSFDLSILCGSWCRSVHLLHLLHLFFIFCSYVLWRPTMMILNLHLERFVPSIHGLDCIRRLWVTMTGYCESQIVGFIMGWKPGDAFQKNTWVEVLTMIYLWYKIIRNFCKQLFKSKKNSYSHTKKIYKIDSTSLTLNFLE